MALWTPAEITTALWYDADGLSAGSLTQWNDDSGNTRHATEATNPPAVIETELNGKSVVRFDGTNDKLVTGDVSLHSGLWTVFAVARATSTAGVRSISSQDRSTEGTTKRIAQYLRFNAGTPESIAFTEPNTAHIASRSATVTNWQVYSAARTANNLRVFANGVGGTSLSVSGTPITGSIPYVIGARVSEPGGFTDFLKGDIAEIVFIAGDVDTDTRQIVEGYLAHKWGLEANLPAEHPYKAEAPTVPGTVLRVATVRVTGRAVSAHIRHTLSAGTIRVTGRPVGLVDARLQRGTARVTGRSVQPAITQLLQRGTIRVTGRAIREVTALQRGTLRITGRSVQPAITQLLQRGTIRVTGRAVSAHIRHTLSGGTARVAGRRLPRPQVRPVGNPVRVYRLRIAAGGETFRVPPVNWSGRFAVTGANYLAVTVHNPDDDLLAAISAALDAEQPVTITIEAGYRWPTGVAQYSPLYSVGLQVLTDSFGPTSRSARFEGYEPGPAASPKQVTIRGTETLRTGTVATGWRGIIDDRVAPGDLVFVDDVPGISFVAGNIVYNIDARSASMDINELTDAEALAGLPW